MAPPTMIDLSRMMEPGLNQTLADLIGGQAAADLVETDREGIITDLVNANGHALVDKLLTSEAGTYQICPLDYVIFEGTGWGIDEDGPAYCSNECACDVDRTRRGAP